MIIPFVEVFPSTAIYPLLKPIFWNLTFGVCCLAVIASGSDCWLLSAVYNIVILYYLYLLTYKVKYV